MQHTAQNTAQSVFAEVVSTRGMIIFFENMIQTFLLQHFQKQQQNGVRSLDKNIRIPW
jgi:predicted thioesterase